MEFGSFHIAPVYDYEAWMQTGDGIDLINEFLVGRYMLTPPYRTGGIATRYG